VVELARRFQARIVINNDAHEPGDLVSRDLRRKVALGAGLSAEECEQAEANAAALVQRLLRG